MADALLTGKTNNYGFQTLSSPVNHVVDASNEGVAYVSQSMTDQAITGVFIRYGSRAGVPPSYIAAIEGVDGSGSPDGVVKGGGTPASVVFTPPADTSWDSAGRWFTLANSYTPTIGELLAITIRHSSGTIDGTNNSSFCRTMSGVRLAPQFPYILTNSGGTWTKSASPLAPFGYRTAAKRFGFLCSIPYTTTVSTAGNRSACAFTLPTAFGSTYKPLGFTFYGRLGSAGNTTKVAVWDSAGTEIASAITIDSDVQSGVTNFGNWQVMFTTPPTLTCGTKYYFGAESISGSIVGIAGHTLIEADDRLAWPLGANRAIATWNGSAWTETNTVLPLVDLILDDIAVPSGGGRSVLIGNQSLVRGVVI